MYGFFDFLEKLIPLKSNKNSKTIESSIIQNIYFKEIALYTAISYIANAISKCEIKCYKLNEEVKDEAYFAFNVSPNRNQTSSQFWHEVIEKMYYEGESLAITHKDDIYCVDSFTVENRPFKGNIYRNIVIDGEHIEREYTSNEVYLFKLDNRKVKELIDGVYKSYGDLISYAAKSYKKSNGAKYKVKMPNIKVGDEEVAENTENMVEEQIKKFINSDEAAYTEFEGYELTDMTPKGKGKDINDVISLRKDIFESTAQACNIPLSLMTGNITNVNDVVKSFITFAVDPITSMIGEELTRKQKGNYEKAYLNWKYGNYFKVDTSRVNHIDILESATNIDKLISSGFACVDDLRALTGMDKKNTEFSNTHFITKNYDTMENRLKGEDATNG